MCCAEDKLFCFGSITVGSRDKTVFNHLVDNKLLTFFTFLRIFKRIKVVRAFGNSCQSSSFSDIQILNMLIEVIHGSTFNTICTLTEINLVQIHSEDFILSIFVLKFLGNKSFLNFTDDGTFLGKESILCQLLGNGTAALYFVTA